MSVTPSTWSLPAGTITVAATPIGNPLDASPRLRLALTQADVIAAEDTRRLAGLASRLGVDIEARIVSSHEHNEAARIPQLLEAARAGQRVVVVSDAGMPTVSDPGFPLVEAAAEAGVPVSVIPGPSAPLVALACSGLPTARFSFEGFLPRKSGERRETFAAFKDARRTLIFFDSPRRLADSLADASAVFGPDRPAAVCRELTKQHEDVWRGTLAQLAERAREGVLGEIVVLIGPAPQEASADVDALVQKALELAAGGMRLKAATKFVAKEAGASARDIYEAALQARD